jgi:hypothetical protein
MATYNSDLIIKNANKSTHGESRELQHMLATVNVAVALAPGDLLPFMNLPAYARVTSACVAASRIDTNGTPTFSLNVGDNGYGAVAGDTSRYFSAATVGRAAAPGDANAVTIMNGRAQNFLNGQPSNLQLFGTVVAAAATFAAGTITFRVGYFIDEPPSMLNQ